MAEINPSLLLQSPQYSHRSPHKCELLPPITTESFVMERGPRFKEYSALRERKLRMKNHRTPEKEKDEGSQIRSILTPRRKQVKISSDFTTPPRRPRIPSVLTQSVPDFSSSLRKENRKPAATLRPVAERSATPPGRFSKSATRVYGKVVVGGGSKSTSSGEKRSGGLLLTARQSCVNMEELKRLAFAAGKEINGRKFSRGVVGNYNKIAFGK